MITFLSLSWTCHFVSFSFLFFSSFLNYYFKHPYLSSFIHHLVEGGHRAILFDRVRGVLPNTVGEGTHFLVPWLQRAVLFDVRTRPRNISTTTGSKDMQMVSLTLRVLHRPDYDSLSNIYQNLGLDYDDRVLPSIGNEVLKAIVAQFDAGELITQRELVRTIDC